MITILWRRLGAFMRRRTAMHDLAMLDDRLLADMGVQRHDIARRVNGTPQASPLVGQSPVTGAAPCLSGWHGLGAQPAP